MNRRYYLDRIQPFDERRDIVVPGDYTQTVAFCVRHFLHLAAASIRERGRFTVALSGGSTPAAIYKAIAASPDHGSVDWNKVWLFWSDERAVEPADPESNYHNALESGLESLGIPQKQIFRMVAEFDIVENAQAYEQCIRDHVPDGAFDLVMLGMGNDGHTASLFPLTHGLHAKGRLVVANWVPRLNTWRMTLTFECIHQARTICIYVLGRGKAQTLTHVLSSSYDPDTIPSQRLGTPTHKALWIADINAAENLLNTLAESEPGD